MKTQHTPGEWRAEPGRFGEIRISVGEKDNYKVIAEVKDVSYRNAGKKEQEANAKLIASAPKLLAALIAVDEFERRNEPVIGTAIINQVREVIKKATL